MKGSRERVPLAIPGTKRRRTTSCAVIDNNMSCSLAENAVVEPKVMAKLYWTSEHAQMRAKGRHKLV
jgi:hypothetical protein